MGFQTLQHKLADLLGWTTCGKIQLPDFQRGYVWDDERVRQLLVTIAQGHPLGAVLILETGNPQIHFESKVLEGTSPTAGTTPDLLVLDGQQRLTSLTQALTGDGNVGTSDNGTRRYFLHIPTAAAHPDDLFDAVRSVPASGRVLTNFNKDVKLDVSTRDLEIAEGYFPLNLAFSHDSMSWLMQYGTTKPQEMQDFFNQVVTPMASYTIPAIELDKQTTMEAVTTVFEKVNQGGVKLTVFELLTAKFAGDRPYFEQHGAPFRLREAWEQIRTQLDHHPALSKFENDDFLQAVTLVTTHASRKATTARKEDVLKLSLADYLTWAPQVSEALVWAAGFLDGEHIHTGDDLPYPKQVVPLAALRVVLGKDADVHGVHARIRQWLWCGILGELYGGAIETRFARDLDQVPPWALDATAGVPITVEAAYFQEARLHTMRTRNSAAYKGVYALLMAQGAKDWIYNQSFDKAHYLAMKVDIHHIFPKAWCAKNGVDYERQESIVNKTPLAKTTNTKLSGNAPSVYRGTIRKEVKVDDACVDALVEAHQIDPELLWADNFERFFVARRTALCTLIEAAMGKPVSYGIDV